MGFRRGVGCLGGLYAFERGGWNESVPLPCFLFTLDLSRDTRDHLIPFMFHVTWQATSSSPVVVVLYFTHMAPMWGELQDDVVR